MGVSGNSIAIKSFQSFAVNEGLLQKVVEAVKEGEKQAKSSGEVRSLEVFYHGFRQNIRIGCVYIVPASVCDSAKDFPVALLYGTAVRLLSLGEEMADLIDLRTGSEFDETTDVEAHLKALKEQAFTVEGKSVSLVVFAPAWAGIREYVCFQYTDDDAKLTDLLRHLVFACYFNPALSSGFDALMTTVDTWKFDVTDITPKLTYPASTESPFRAYPELMKAAASRDRVFLTVRTADALAKEQVEPSEMNVFESLGEALGKALKHDTKSPEEAASPEYKKPDASAEVPRADDGTGPKTAGGVPYCDTCGEYRAARADGTCPSCGQGMGKKEVKQKEKAEKKRVKQEQKEKKKADFEPHAVPGSPMTDEEMQRQQDFVSERGGEVSALDDTINYPDPRSPESTPEHRALVHAPKGESFVVKKDNQIVHGPCTMEECLDHIMDSQGAGIGLDRGGWEIEEAGKVAAKERHDFSCTSCPHPKSRHLGDGGRCLSCDCKKYTSKFTEESNIAYNYNAKQADTADNPANEKGGEGAMDPKTDQEKKNTRGEEPKLAPDKNAAAKDPAWEKVAKCPKCGGAITAIPKKAGLYYCGKCARTYRTKAYQKGGALSKVAYVAHCKGHKNSKGELAEWCVKSHEDGHIISSHTSEAEAKKHLQDMHAHKGAVQPDQDRRTREWTVIDPECPAARTVQLDARNQHVDSCPRCQQYNRQMEQEQPPAPGSVPPAAPSTVPQEPANANMLAMLRESLEQAKASGDTEGIAEIQRRVNEYKKGIVAARKRAYGIHPEGCTCGFCEHKGDIADKGKEKEGEKKDASAKTAKWVLRIADESGRGYSFFEEFATEDEGKRYLYERCLSALTEKFGEDDPEIRQMAEEEDWDGIIDMYYSSEPESYTLDYVPEEGMGGHSAAGKKADTADNPASEKGGEGVIHPKTDAEKPKTAILLGIKEAPSCPDCGIQTRNTSPWSSVPGPRLKKQVWECPKCKRVVLEGFDKSGPPKTAGISAKDLSFRYGLNGYMLTYKGKDIGGAGVKTPRERPVTGRQHQKVIDGFKLDAQNAVRDILAGRVSPHMAKAIAEIDGSPKTAGLTHGQYYAPEIHEVVGEWLGLGRKQALRKTSDIQMTCPWCKAAGRQPGIAHKQHPDEEFRCTCGWSSGKTAAEDPKAKTASAKTSDFHDVTKAEDALRALEGFFSGYSDTDPKDDIKQAFHALEGSASSALEDIRTDLERAFGMDDFSEAADIVGRVQLELDTFVETGGHGNLPQDEVAAEIAAPPEGSMGVAASGRSRQEARKKEARLRRNRQGNVREFGDLFSEAMVRLRTSGETDEPSKRWVTWDVFLNGKKIDSVTYRPEHDAEYVRKGLINHDGYDPGIQVQQRKTADGYDGGKKAAPVQPEMAQAKAESEPPPAKVPETTDPAALEKQKGSEDAGGVPRLAGDINISVSTDDGKSKVKSKLPLGDKDEKGKKADLRKVGCGCSRCKTPHAECSGFRHEAGPCACESVKTAEGIQQDLSSAREKLDHGAKSNLSNNPESVQTKDPTELARQAGHMVSPIGRKCPKCGGGLIAKKKGGKGDQFDCRNCGKSFQVSRPEKSKRKSMWDKKGDQSVAPEVAQAKAGIEGQSKAELADSPEATQTTDPLDLSKQAALENIRQKTNMVQEINNLERELRQLFGPMWQEVNDPRVRRWKELWEQFNAVPWSQQVDTKQGCAPVGDDLDEAVDMEVGLGDLANLGANLPPVTWGEKEVPQAGEGGLNNEPKPKKAAVAPKDPLAFSQELATAFSTDKYGNGQEEAWVGCIKALRRKGYSDRQIEAIVRSKWTRWAAERAGKQRRATSGDLLRFMEVFTDNGANPERLKREVDELTAETAQELGWEPEEQEQPAPAVPAMPDGQQQP